MATSPPPAPPAMSNLAVTQEQAQTRAQMARKSGLNSTIPGMLGGDLGGNRPAAAQPGAGGKNSLLGGG